MNSKEIQNYSETITLKESNKDGIRNNNRNHKNNETETINYDKNPIFAIEQKLSELSSQKKQIENEIFKLPEKQRTLIQINRKKMLEDQVCEIEKEINFLRIKLREGNKK